MFRFIVLAAVVLPAIFAVDPLPCSSGAPLPSAARVEGCAALPCDIQDGTSVRFEVDFTPSRNMAAPEANMDVWVAGESFPYELPAALRDACQNTIPACPLVAGRATTYRLDYPVNAPLTGVTADLEVSLRDGAGTLVCARITANIIA